MRQCSLSLNKTGSRPSTAAYAGVAGKGEVGAQVRLGQ